MTPEQKIKWLIITKTQEVDKEFPQDSITQDNVDGFYDEYYDELGGMKCEVREGEVETDLEEPYSRHYEAKSVAAKLPDGSWVGWTYWYGGGKHGCPEEIEWMSDAYDLECEEVKRTMTVRTFTKKEGK